MNSVYKEFVSTLEHSVIKTNENMGKYTSFKTGGNANFFIKTKSINDIKKILEIANLNNIPLIVLGNGSNMLFKESGFDGIVLKIELDKIIIKNETVTVDAGAKNAIISKKILDNELQGFEFMSGIPGTIGGAIRMNAGAYGGEIKDLVKNVTYIDYSTTKIETITNKECNFSYRHSVFGNNKNIIISAELKLKKGSKEEIKNKIDEYTKYRKEKQPWEYPNAGSTFKRGKDFITSKIIDECGLKGYTIGGAQVSTKHAGFIINKNNATPTDILKLIEYVKTTVYKKTGKLIELEIEII